MRISEHSGDCCGLYIIHGFGKPTINSIQEFHSLVSQCLSDYDEDDIEEEGRSSLGIEVILTRYQLGATSKEAPNGWAGVLKDAGFELTAWWINPNTDNYLYQFMYMPNKECVDIDFWTKLKEKT